MADCIKFAFCCFLFLILVAVQVFGSSGSERRALLELRASLGVRARSWPRKVDPCLNWTGIECTDGVVTGITLSGLRRTRSGQQNPRFAVDSLSNLTSLSVFNASGFPLPGPIPGWLGQRVHALQVLDLRFCAIVGLIPESVGSLRNLRLLYLSDNSLTGQIPAALGKLLTLSKLDLSRNLLTGSIPAEILVLKNLSSLALSSNFLSGVIPLELGVLTSLISLKLDNNSLSDSIPVQLGNLSELVEIDVGLNQLQGPVPENLLKNLGSLEYVNLRSNRFNGSFPDGLSSLRNLSFLDVSNNGFTGGLPDISAFLNDDRIVLNFSSNQLSGNLSSESGVRMLDLSGNFFTGVAPKGNVSLNCFQNRPDQRNATECRQFYPDIGIGINNGTVENPSSESDRAKKLKYILGGSFGGLGFILLIGLALAFLLQKWAKNGTNVRGIADVKPAPEKEANPVYFTGLGAAFTYDQILQATNNFNDMNLIKHGRSGDIYRGKLEAENVVIIKRVGTGTWELDVLKKIQHPRFAPLIGHSLEPENEKMLVYKYMPNGDLSSALFNENSLEESGLQSLDWITRLKISIGTAEAISFLHHDCNPPLVHRDIQPSSILLDDKYEVRLGSLSEVCVQGADSNQQKSARKLRMSQTTDKSAGLSSATCAYDVYCFGKVLLGLVTGKLEICNSDSELETVLSCITLYEKESLTRIIDQSLIIDDDLLEEMWAVAIVARSCLNPRPSRRPLMRHILRALENPFKVIREESFSSGRLRTSSSRKYWSIAFFGSWQQSSSDGDQTRKEGVSGLKQAGRLGSRGSTSAIEYSSSNKRSSSEIFPEPTEIQDVEKQDTE